MKEIHIQPDRRQRTVWLIHWSLWFFPVLILLLILLSINSIVVGLCSLAWLALMLPFAFWIPAYFRSLEYTIADDVVTGQRGVFFKRYVTMPYQKITNVDITQGPLQRKFGVGYIHCQTAGSGGQQGGRAELKMEGIEDLEGVKEAIMERIKKTALAASEPRRPQQAASTTGSILEPMLTELRAIRQALEKRS